MKPTIGRVVIYTARTYSTGYKVESPAIVEAVNEDGSLRLCVFECGGRVQYDVKEGTGEGQWRWPDVPKAPAPPAPVAAPKGKASK